MIKGPAKSIPVLRKGLATTVLDAGKSPMIGFTGNAFRRVQVKTFSDYLPYLVSTCQWPKF
jgi:hypothetical protein